MLCDALCRRNVASFLTKVNTSDFGPVKVMPIFYGRLMISAKAVLVDVRNCVDARVVLDFETDSERGRVHRRIIQFGHVVYECHGICVRQESRESICLRRGRLA